MKRFVFLVSFMLAGSAAFSYSRTTSFFNILERGVSRGVKTVTRGVEKSVENRVTGFFSRGAFSLGLGSGFVFYGDEKLRNALDAFDADTKFTLMGDTSFSLDLSGAVKLTFGLVGFMDSRWSGEDDILLMDYAATVGFDFYPTRSGFFFSVDYCLGQRFDMLEASSDDSIVSAAGNGFALEAGYNFAYPRNAFGFILSASWRQMARGNYSNDNIIDIKVKLAL